jgi:hypothetical protein
MQKGKQRNKTIQEAEVVCRSDEDRKQQMRLYISLLYLYWWLLPNLHANSGYNKFGIFVPL